MTIDLLTSDRADTMMAYMSDSTERARAHRHNITRAIRQGLDDARAHHLTKDADLATCIVVALADFGLAIVRRPTHKLARVGPTVTGRGRDL